MFIIVIILEYFFKKKIKIYNIEWSYKLFLKNIYLYKLNGSYWICFYFFFKLFFYDIYVIFGNKKILFYINLFI